MIAATPREIVSALGLVLGLSACASLGYGRSSDGEEEEVVLYGTEQHPGDPPDNCKRLAKIEVSALEKKTAPEGKLKNAALDEGGNAVGHIRSAGFTDGYLGKEYSWRAIAFSCPSTKKAPAASASASGQASASAAPTTTSSAKTGKP